MNYEELYNEALERARAIYQGKYKPEIAATIAETLQSIFPELKESEDEKIRKEILDYIAKSTGCERCVAWLENQGEQKSAEWHREDEQNLNACLGFIPHEFLRRWLKDVVHVKYDNPVNEVKPKFKVGDWVIFNNKHCSIYQVEKIENYRYTLRHTTGGSTSLLFGQEYFIRLWTIEDAKDGDVLVSSANQPFIYNGKFNSISIDGHCGLDITGIFIDNKHVQECNWTENKNIKPATKEQRDRLFAKIKEAGYEWHSDTKELFILVESNQSNILSN